MKNPVLFLCVAIFVTSSVARAAVTIDLVTIKVNQVGAVPLVSPQFPTPPITVVRGAHVQLVITPPNQPNSSVGWYRDGQRLAATGTTLDIASAVPADSGLYAAKLYDADGTTVTWLSESVPVFVTNPGQRLRNVATRARIDSNQPFFLTGFVVEPGPGKTRVVVRAVGPTLAVFGIADALTAPQLRVADANGHVVSPANDLVSISPLPGTPVPPSAAELEAEAAGAFPVGPGGTDTAQVYMLPQGAYTAELSSANGGTGTALLEIYEIAY